MNKEQFNALVNKGAITHVGVAQDVETLSAEEMAELHMTQHEAVAEMLAGDDEDTDTPTEPEPDPDPEKTPEQIAEEFTTALKAGGDVTLEGDIAITAKLALAKPATVDFGGYTVKNETVGGDAIQLGGGDFTFKNGVIDNVAGGGSSAGIYANSSKGNNITLEDMKITAAYPVYLNNATGQPACTIKSGKYVSPNDKGVAVYVEKGGKVTIEGGEFGTDGHPSDFVLNILDATRKDKEVRDFILVKGGKFYGFDPANNASEGPGTNYVADGYESVETEPGVFEVRKAAATPEAPTVDPVAE